MMLDDHNCDGDCETGDCSGRTICPLMMDNEVDVDVDYDYRPTDIDPNEVC